MKTHSKTPLFLMELVIMLFVFAAASAVCLRVFAEAQKISAESQALDYAVTECQKAAEFWKSTHGDLEETAAKMNGTLTEGGFSVYYTEDWKPAEKAEPFQLTFSADAATAQISMKKNTEAFFSLPCEAVIFP